MIIIRDKKKLFDKDDIERHRVAMRQTENTEDENLSYLPKVVDGIFT